MTEDSWSLALFGQHEQHLHILTGIKTAGIHHRYSPISIYIDALAYLLILLGMIKNCTLRLLLFTTWSMQNA